MSPRVGTVLEPGDRGEPSAETLPWWGIPSVLTVQCCSCSVPQHWAALQGFFSSDLSQADLDSFLARPEATIVLKHNQA